MFCMRCGQDVPVAAEFCPACGQSTKLPVAPAASYGSAPPPIQQAAVPPPGAGEANLKGVAGWLLFFCICFTVFWPLWVLSQYALHRIVFRPLSALGLLRMAFGVVVGVLLWAESRSALVLLRIYFVISVVLQAWNIFNFFTLMLRYNASFLSSTMISWLMSTVFYVLFLVLGIAYFAKSERVRATFGENLL